MYFVLLFNFKVFQFRARKERQREKFESIDRATDKKKRSIRRFDVLRVWRSLSFLAAVKERKFERREKASFRNAEKRYLYTYPPEDGISVMAARTPTAIIAKVNANSFSTIDIFAGNAPISKYRYWMFA